MMQQVGFVDEMLIEDIGPREDAAGFRCAVVELGESGGAARDGTVAGEAWRDGVERGGQAYQPD
jgi:hypothetical protein